MFENVYEPVLLVKKKSKHAGPGVNKLDVG